MLTRTYNSLLRCISDQLSRNNSIEATQVDRAFVQEAIDDLFGELEYDSIPLNNEYWVCTKEDFKTIVRRDLTNWMRYEHDRHDCVDFTNVFRAGVSTHYGLNNVGRIISWKGTSHMFNVIVFADGSAEIFEPQRGHWLGLSDRGRQVLFSDGAHDLSGAAIEI